MLGIIMNHTIIEVPDGIDISYNGNIYHFATLPEDIETTLQTLEATQIELLDSIQPTDELSADTFKVAVAEVVDKYTYVLNPTEIENTFIEVREEMLVPPLNSEAI